MSELDNAAANGSPTLQEILSLPYMDACVKEGMRLVAPFGGPMPRLSPPGGVTISGSYIPQNTLICVMHDAVHYDHRVFPQPEMFDPARWTERQTDDMNRCFLGVSRGNAVAPSRADYTNSSVPGPVRALERISPFWK